MSLFVASHTFALLGNQVIAKVKDTTQLEEVYD